MRTLFLLFLAFFTTVASAQDRSQIWFSAGVKREVAKNITAGVGTNARIAMVGSLQTLFQEASIKSEHIKWFRPSIDYRFITSYERNGNYVNSQRLNFNADFRGKISDFKFGTRFRYQIYLGDFIATGTDLDPSFRIKPYVDWSIPDTRFTAGLSTEFFYNPQNGQFGDRFNRTRFGASLNIDLPNSNELDITYYYGRRYNTNNPYQENIVSLEYTYEWKTAKQKEEKNKKSKKKSDEEEKPRSIRTL